MEFDKSNLIILKQNIAVGIDPCPEYNSTSKQFIHTKYARYSKSPVINQNSSVHEVQYSSPAPRMVCPCSWILRIASSNLTDVSVHFRLLTRFPNHQ